MAQASIILPGKGAQSGLHTFQGDYGPDLNREINEVLSCDHPVDPFSAVPFNLGDLMASTGCTASKCLDFIDDYYSRGILPPGCQVTEASNRIEKSNHSNLTGQFSKYPQYRVHTYVDVKHRDRWLWNLVGNGVCYPSVYEGGELVRPGCGWLYKDEGYGCLRAPDHKTHQAIVKLIQNSCMRPQCPVCYEKWAAREAYRIDERFRRVPKLAGEDQGKAESRSRWGVPIHVVISVPEAEAYLMDLLETVTKGGKFVKKHGYKKLKRKMAQIAKMVGFWGGCAIFHPFANDSVPEDTDIEIRVDPASGEFDWKALKEYFKKQNKDIKLWYIRPHFHLIGYGWIVDVDQVYAKTGWVVKNLGVRDSVMSTALYLLSHAGYREGQHTVSWLGFMSNRTFKDCDPLPPDGFRPATCPECGEELVPVRWFGEGPSPLDHVQEEGFYYVDPGGWREISLGEYRGRIVKPLPGEHS